VFLVVYRNHALVMEDQYLRAYGIGDTHETNPDAYQLRKRYHLLYMYYKPRTPFWLLMVLGRKFLISMTSLMFRGNPTFQMTVILLVLFISFVMQAKYRPFLSTGERGVVIKELELRASLAINDPIHFQQDYEMLKKITTAVRLGGEIERRQKAGKVQKKVENLWADSNDKTKTRRAKIARDAGSYFFDFNTVELILLGSAIIISLCGIMFNSGEYNGRPDLDTQRDTITYIMLIIVFFTFLYMFTVALAEIAPWLYTRYFARFMKHNDTKIAKELEEGVVMNENALLNAKMIGAVNADELSQALESSQNALKKTMEQNKQLETNLNDMRSGR